MENEDKKTGGNQDSILGEIIIYAVLIIILLIFLLRIVDRVDEKTVNPQPATDTLGFVEKNLKEPVSSVSQSIEEQGGDNTDRLMEQLEGIAEYIKANQNSIPESEIRKIREELEQFRKSMASYPKLISEKLDRIAALVEKQDGSKVTYTATPPLSDKKRNPHTGKKISAPKAETTPIRQKIPKIPETAGTVIKGTEEKQPVKPLAREYPDIREEKPPVFTVSERILSPEEIENAVLMENKGISGKTLCYHSRNTVHFLSNQVLVRLVNVYPPDGWNTGSAMIDITHPRLGLRRFAEMEEGTTRPFEYGRKTYFLELLKLHGDCADVAVYERKSS